ncbi:MAG: hypothetical protein HYU63_03420 [Armatimonadetes bacterium]|nr:hypothetical protein [Armatimonadota bacterium]
MSIYRVLDKLENAIYNSPRLPLFWRDQVLISREKILSLIEKTRTSLPEEMKQARWISKEKEKIIQEAKEESQKILEESGIKAMNILEEVKEKRAKFLNESEIIKEAKEISRKILEETKLKAENIFKDADSKSQEIINKGEEEARSLYIRTQSELSETKRSVAEYTNQILLGLERELERILKTIAKAKEHFNKEN